MQKYSPFDKPINELQASDLAVLRDVSEGWYVEYKSQVPKGSALAKAVSAFANTYGGWLFLGIEEKSKEDPAAESYPGIPSDEVESTLQRLRQSTNAHLSPIPHFESKVLQGPSSEIQLADEASIVAVEVPQSHTTPHVHKDGRIYRRVADSSESKAETDRFILDQLWRRADPIRKEVRRWVKNDPEFSEAEAQMPYLRLLLSADPWRQRSPWLNAPTHEIRSLFSRQEAGLPSAPFETFYTTANGFIARQAEGNDPHDLGMTWKIQRDLSSEMIFPLRLCRPSQYDDDVQDIRNYKHGTYFLNLLIEKHYTTPKIAD
ncbi:MAG: ATP-binding protein, partial [Chloroflexi bacterium]|nr:ATP-binding protein [Chloroflexota bacterium]